MKKTLLFLFILSTLLCSCKVSREYNISVTNIPHEADGKKAYLTVCDSVMKDHIAIDSATIKDGRVDMKGIYTKKATMAQIRLTPQISTPTIMLEAGDINITFNEFSYNIDGTKRNRTFHKFFQFQTEQLREVEEKRRLQEKVEDDFDAVVNIEKEYRDRGQKLMKEQARIIRKNIKNELGIRLFLLEKDQLFGPEEQLSLVKKLPSYWHKEPAVQNIVETANAQIATAVGKPYIDIIGKKQNGENTSISEIVKDNDYTLLFFWASRCPPCRRNLPDLKEIYEKYHTKGLAIVNISMDNKKNLDSWEKAIKEEELPGINLILENNWNSEALKSYGVKAIPHVILINREGNIISRGLLDILLKIKLEELLK